MPERWAPKGSNPYDPDLVRHKDSLNSFSSGPYGCIGKNLAYLEMRLLTAELITRYSVEPAQGEDGQELLHKSRDHFTLGLGDCRLVFKKL
jgi:cytochrome P450